MWALEHHLAKGSLGGGARCYRVSDGLNRKSPGTRQRSYGCLSTGCLVGSTSEASHDPFLVALGFLGRLPTLDSGFDNVTRSWSRLSSPSSSPALADLLGLCPSRADLLWLSSLKRLASADCVLGLDPLPLSPPRDVVTLAGVAGFLRPVVPVTLPTPARVPWFIPARTRLGLRASETGCLGGGNAGTSWTALVSRTQASLSSAWSGFWR
jgi:hypothetical protein